MRRSTPTSSISEREATADAATYPSTCVCHLAMESVAAQLGRGRSGLTGCVIGDAYEQALPHEHTARLLPRPDSGWKEVADTCLDFLRSAERSSGTLTGHRGSPASLEGSEHGPIGPGRSPAWQHRRSTGRVEGPSGPLVSGVGPETHDPKTRPAVGSASRGLAELDPPSRYRAATGTSRRRSGRGEQAAA